jgi:hypothetical protein
VNVEQAKVAVERQQLENRQQFAEAGIQLEIQRLSIQADRDVQIEFAKSLASFLANGHMTLYGTPETATQMLDNMAKGFGLRSMIEGFVNGPVKNGNGAAPTLGLSNGATAGKNGNGSGDAVGALLSQIGGLLQPAIAKVTGSIGENTPTATPEVAEQVAKRLAEDPALLAALRNALATQQAPAPASAALSAPTGATVDEPAKPPKAVLSKTEKAEAPK